MIQSQHPPLLNVLLRIIIQFSTYRLYLYLYIQARGQDLILGRVQTKLFTLQIMYVQVIEKSRGRGGWSRPRVPPLDTFLFVQ